MKYFLMALLLLAFTYAIPPFFSTNATALSQAGACQFSAPSCNDLLSSPTILNNTGAELTFTSEHPLTSAMLALHYGTPNWNIASSGYATFYSRNYAEYWVRMSTGIRIPHSQIFVGAATIVQIHPNNPHPIGISSLGAMHYQHENVVIGCGFLYHSRDHHAWKSTMTLKPIPATGISAGIQHSTAEGWSFMSGISLEASPTSKISLGWEPLRSRISFGIEVFTKEHGLNLARSSAPLIPEAYALTYRYNKQGRLP
jgi:hypothetical protein